MYSVSIVIPTYNEAKNLPLLFEEILQFLSPKEFDVEFIVVDDNSPDGTGQVAEELKKKYSIKVIHRSEKKGLGSAVRAGFKESIRPIIGVMDADLSHNPEILPNLIRSLDTYDIASGSRFAEGSEVQEWKWWRKLLSQVGVAITKRLTGVKDPLSGFFFLRRSVIEGVNLTTTGYKILLEILVKGRFKKVLELPFQFRMRKFSSSKLNWVEHWLFLKQVTVYSLYLCYKKTIAHIRENKLFWIVLGIAGALLFSHVSKRTFWMDETAVLVYLNQRPFSFIIDYFREPDNHPPIYYLLVVLVSKLLPWTELTVRLVSILASLGVISVVYVFSLRIWADKKTAALSAVVTAISAYFVLIGQMARYHSLTAFFNLLALYFFYKLTQEAWTKVNAIWFVVMSILVCLTDYPHFIYTLAITNGYIFYRLIRKRLPGSIRSWFVMQAIIMASFLPMAWLLFHRIFIQGDGGFEKHNLLANSAIHIVIATCFHVYAFFFSENILPWNFVIFGLGVGVLLVSLFGLFLGIKRKVFSRAHFFIIGLFLAYIVGNTFFLNIFNPRYNFIVYPKYVFVAFPLWSMVLVGCWSYYRSVYLKVFLVGAWLIVAVFGLYNFYNGKNYLNASYFNTFSGFEFVRDNSASNQFLLITGDANIGVYNFYRDSYFSKLQPVEKINFDKLPVGSEAWFFSTGSDDPAKTVSTESLIPNGYTVIKKFDSAPLDPYLKKYKEKTLGRESYTYKYSVFLLKRI